jgi:23S rRNA (cytidine1920-2'-O)/16S rRNA (cytidine1409-2'-O)-methyltransferase
MTKQRLDQLMVSRGLVPTRSQAESYIKLKQVKVDNKFVTKPGQLVEDQAKIDMLSTEQYVSRAGLKLASIAKTLKLDFRSKVVLDVGSSTGGFTDYALKHGATKVIAVDVGTNQMHPSLSSDPRVELHEQTDIRNYNTDQQIDAVVIDVSFISLRKILPKIAELVSNKVIVVVMVKPQFEAGSSGLKHKGVVKNERMRRDILKDFETWVAQTFVVQDKADSGISGAHGNLERFYVLRKA